ncbi:Fic family protein [Arcticibacter eurypsychrophilus]|uniref:Fic family protein n=1 Tax=Arcticibacter eurypsychrophilus TaxID=1434752 RepID=UPI00084DB412|nr:Fic family protein [Arcticibacter eurypsychrophilus]
MDINELVAAYKRLRIEQVIDYTKFNLIAIDHHSTRIEGSTLTEVEAQVLINEGLTPKGKPLEESLMLTDHHAALLFTIEQAKGKKILTVPVLQKINSLVMKSTGKVYNTMLGTVDSTTGAFRKGNVTAGSSYFPNFDKVERLTLELVNQLNERMSKPLSLDEQLNLSFDAHFNLVSIHPFYDGNGRTSRLLMNYLQTYYDLPLAIVHSENKVGYIQALIDTRENADIQRFRNFMVEEYAALLKKEIERFKAMDKPSKGTGFNLLF